jgi:hypothetical protein
MHELLPSRDARECRGADRWVSMPNGAPREPWPGSGVGDISRCRRRGDLRVRGRGWFLCGSLPHPLSRSAILPVRPARVLLPSDRSGSWSVAAVGPAALPWLPTEQPVRAGIMEPPCSTRHWLGASCDPRHRRCGAGRSRMPSSALQLRRRRTDYGGGGTLTAASTSTP